MGKINILQPNVFNMLAAGEVVERPSSVVKELVENSLDAGATEVYIDIELGGTRKIQVSDNGIGIAREDLRSAFLPHATSKLSSISDLDSLATLGFRGEALASIASVSNVTLVSAQKSGNMAAKIVLNGGTVVLESEASRNEGTIITVENLFFNTPARLKFLKKPQSESRYVLDTIRMLVLANPSVSITLRDESGVLLSNEGGSLADAICAVYGAKTLDRMHEIMPVSSGNIKVGGYISACDFTKPNRTYQTVIINGRVVQDATVQTAVEKAYGDYLMKRSYPMFVLDIIMPFDEVDANVHPSKTEVRFLDGHKVFGAVYHAVLNTINKNIKDITYGFSCENPLPTSPSGSVYDGNAVSHSDNTLNLNRIAGTLNPSAPVAAERAEARIEYPVQQRIDTSAFYQGKTAPKNAVYNEFAFLSSDVTLKDRQLSAKMEIDNRSECVNSSNFDEDARVFDGKIIGQAFSTYLLVERDDAIYIIDQHAAHERILYDRIVAGFDVKYSQSLVMPYKLVLTGSEEEYLDGIMPQLEAFGFEIEKNGAAYMINAVPAPVADMNFEKFFGELFENRLSQGEITLVGLLKERLCQQACKAAIKGGEPLSRIQIERVIKNYVDESGNLPAKCPHGRPAVAAVTKRDFEKLFKRVL